MKFRVRSKEGELQYESFGQVEQAWLLGFIEPDDELLEEGHTKWRKARSYPLLMSARRSGEQVWVGSWFAWTVLGIMGASYALWQLHLGNYVVGIIAAFVVGGVMTKVTVTAAKRSKPHHR